MNPYVFFVGCPRSGTTLVQRLGNAHPELAVAHETRWIARWYANRIGLTSDGHVTAALVERLPQHARFKAFKMKPEELADVYRDRELVSYADFVSRLFDRFAARRGKRLAGDKTPDYALHIRTLHELWPRAKFVHIIRDGRDVCLSMLEWQKGAARFSTWHDDPRTTIAVWWDWHVRLGREAGFVLGPDLYHEVRYEALVADPAGQCARLCAFLGIPYDDAMLRFHEGRIRSEPGLDAKKAWRPVTAGLRTWKAQMPDEDTVRFESAAGVLLADLGYERAVPSPHPDDIARATRVRSQFERDVRARGGAIPEAWKRRVA
jgi:hypothetical protein